MDKGNSLLLGLVVGGVIGGISILLSTPKSGNELRTTLKDGRKEIASRLQNIKIDTKEFFQLLERSTIEGKEVVQDFSEDVQKAITVWLKEIKPHQKNIQKELQEIEQTLLRLENETVKKRQKPTIF